MTDDQLQTIEHNRDLQARSRELCAVSWRLKQDIANMYCVCARNRMPGLMRRHGMTRQEADPPTHLSTEAIRRIYAELFPS